LREAGKVGKLNKMLAHKSESETLSVGSLSVRYLAERGVVHLTGIQALTRVVLDAVRSDANDPARRTGGFVSGYEGSPLGGLDLELARNRELLDAWKIVHRPAINEELAATAVSGSQLAATLDQSRFTGAIGVWYGKAPGLDRASDAIRHANLMGTSPTGGVLAMVGDDPTSKSSTLPSASEHALADLAIPVLYPADAQETLRLGRHGVALSRISGLWVAMKMVTEVADGSGTCDLDLLDTIVLTDAEKEVLATREPPSPRLIGGRHLEFERSAFDDRMKTAASYGRVHGLNRITQKGDKDRVALVAAGKTYLDLLEALRILGATDSLASLGIRLVQIGMPYPIDTATITEIAQGVEAIVVVEEKRPFVELRLKEVLYGASIRPDIVGKQDEVGGSLFPIHYALDPALIANVLRDYLDRRFGVRLATRVASINTAKTSVGSAMIYRAPFFCSGCPHLRSLQTPPGTLVGAGIGCAGMVESLPSERVGNVLGMTQMGGEGAQWIGISPFISEDHFTQNMGDGTFFHSGHLAVRAAVASGINVTYKILYNSAVALTGGQKVGGARGVPALCRLLAAEGVSRIAVTTDHADRYQKGALPPEVEVRPRSDVVEVQETLARVRGVTVLIHDQECAAELRRSRRRGTSPDPVRRLVINERICEGCGDCSRASSCLSLEPVETPFGTKTRINQASCNKDFTCLEGNCPSFVTVRAANPVAAVRIDDALLEDIPAPPELESPTPTSVRFVGIGGTGVVTVAQILGVAAWLDGLAVRGVDQTGLSQKAGAVVSDVRFAPGPFQSPSAIGIAQCDVYVACDVLAASDDNPLKVASPTKTTAVVNGRVAPTGTSAADQYRVVLDAEQFVKIVAERTHDVHVLDAHRLAERLLGSEQYANVVLLGAAYQSGHIPVSAGAIERAIGLNATAVTSNVRAFRVGRLAISNPQAVDTVHHSESAAEDLRLPSAVRKMMVPPVPQSSDLEAVLARSFSELNDYQDRRYAQRYIEAVAEVRGIEAALTDKDTVTVTFARSLYKLMAYKDEYEVARLALDPRFRASLKTGFGDDARVAWQLHPPILGSLGLKRKVTLGGWFGPMFRLLRVSRRLRGTPFDPFGRTRVRRVERSLRDEFESIALGAVREHLVDHYEDVLCLVGLPDIVRGYEEVKLASVVRYRAELTAIRARLVAGPGADMMPDASSEQK